MSALSFIDTTTFDEVVKLFFPFALVRDVFHNSELEIFIFPTNQDKGFLISSAPETFTKTMQTQLSSVHQAIIFSKGMVEILV